MPTSILAKPDHSLADHALNSLITADVLCDEHFSPWFLNQITTATSLPACSLLKFWSYIHDIGKANTVFQNCIKHDDSQPLHHAYLGFLILIKHYHLSPTICAPVLLHHGSQEKPIFKSTSASDFSQFIDISYVPHWNKLLSDALKYSDLSIEQLQTAVLPATLQLKCTGAVQLIDHIASNEYFFKHDPTLTIPQRKQHFIDTYPFAKKQLFSDPPVTDFLFQKRFGFTPRSAQHDILEAVDRIKYPGLFTFKAPMGIGKTEGSLAAAEIIASKFGLTKIIFALPTQATANGLFSRIIKWAETTAQLYGCAIDVNLIHRKSRFTQEKRKLRKSFEIGPCQNYFADSKHEAFTASIDVCTIDQVLAACQRRKHMTLTQFNLTQSILIIDEVHSCDIVMKQYLQKLLQIAAVDNCPVILSTATLTNEMLYDLIRAYTLPGEKPLKAWKDRKKLPTWLNDIPDAALIVKNQENGFIPQTISLKCEPHKIHINVQLMKNDIDWKKIAEQIKQQLKGKGVAGIIMNTVPGAQNAFDELSKYLPNYKLHLQHSRYTGIDRAENEKLIIELTGKNSGEKERIGHIFIGTQVFEQSLDLDFDYMISEIAPVELLLQRFGRLYRHRKHDPIRPTKTAAVCILDTKKSKIYHSHLLEQTRYALNELTDITLPDDIQPLIDNAAAFTETGHLHAYESECQEKINETMPHLIAELPDEDTDLYETLLTDELMKDAVRDIAGATIEIIILKRENDTLYTQDGHTIITNDGKYDPNSIQTILKRTIKLQAPEGAGQKDDIWHDDAWKNTPALQSIIPVICQENETFILGQTRYHYTRKKGLEKCQKPLTQPSTPGSRS